MEFFRQVQWAFKIMAPQLQNAFRAAVAGTPLLPRDLFLMLVSNRMAQLVTVDGGMIFSMAQLTDMRAMLEIISQTAGDMLVRGPEYWEALAAGPEGMVLTSQGEATPPAWLPPSGGGGGTWIAFASITITSPVALIDIPGIDASEVLLIQDGVTKSVSGVVAGRLSVNNGASFYAGATDYGVIAQTGVVTGTSFAFGVESTNATAARSGWVTLQGLNVTGVPKMINAYQPGPGLGRIFKASLLPVNALRILPSGGGNLTGGTFHVLTR